MENENKAYEFQGVGLTRSEKTYGLEKFKEYCSIYHINQFSDMQLLEELIYKEINQERFKESLLDKKIKHEKENKKLPEDKKLDFNAPAYMSDAMNENLERILTLKKELGLLNKEDQNDGFTYIEQLRKKFKLWEAENQASRTFVCPNCAKMLMLHVKPDMWEVQEHKFFRDKILCNEHLVKLFKEKKITDDDCAKILGVSKQYVLWLIDKWYSHE